jgi:hypothetical protein
MSWYKIIKKSMPIKRVKIPEESEFDYDWQKIDLEEKQKRIDEYIPEEIEDPFGDMEAVGGGAFGVAYYPTSEPNKVVKITDHHNEYDVAQKVMAWQEANGGFHPAIVGIYSAEEMEYEGMYGAPLVRLVLEKVQPAYSTIKKIRNESPAEHLYQERDKLKDKLIKHDLWVGDLHEFNFGYRPSTGEIVVLDIGHLSGAGVDIV